MRIHYQDNRTTLYHGDCRQVLAALPERSVQCVVTSPPYWGLRDYGIQPVEWSNGDTAVWGLEERFESYIEHTLEVFEAIGRVLRDDGVIWWNLGDSFAQSGKGGNPEDFIHRKQATNRGSLVAGSPLPQGFQPGDKMLIPHRVAIALQDAGWCVRQDVVWGKKSPMPESIRGWQWIRCMEKVAGCSGPNRHGVRGANMESGWDHETHPETRTPAEFEPCPGCEKCDPHGGYVLRRGNWRHTTAHEFVFMVTKGMGYFCDGEAAKEATTGNAHSRGCGSHPKSVNGTVGVEKQNPSYSAAVNEVVSQRNPRDVILSEEMDLIRRVANGENVRDAARMLWEQYSLTLLATEPYKGAHFATYPSKLVLPLLRASTSPAGCCPSCGQCWAPVVESDRVATRPGNDTKVGRVGVHDDSPYHDHNGMICGNRDPQRHTTVTRTQGYRQTCDCQSHEPVPSIVMDICNGSGTTGQVARHLGLRYIGIECNAEYLDMAVKRIQTPLEKPKARKHESAPGQRSLFEFTEQGQEIHTDG